MTEKLEIPVKLEVKFPLPDGRTLVQGPLTYNHDGLATRHNCDFIRDPRFAEAYRFGMRDWELGNRPGTNIEWRVHVALWLAAQAAQLEGDFVECGVNTGILSGAIMTWLNFERFAPRKFYLLDTFSGIPEEQLSEEERRAGNQRMNEKYRRGEEIFTVVQEKFSNWPNAIVVRGKVPDTLIHVAAEKVAYLSIDMNVVEPEIAAAEFFWPRLSSGAFVLLDDYGWAAHYNQKRAFDEFARRHGVEILALPTGQGVIRKP